MIGSKSRKKRSKRGSQLSNIVTSIISFGPLATLYISPAIVLFGIYKGIGPMNFVFHWLPMHHLPTSFVIGMYILAFVLLTHASLTVTQILIMMVYAMVSLTYLFSNNLRFLDKDYKKQKTASQCVQALRYKLWNYKMNCF